MSKHKHPDQMNIQNIQKPLGDRLYIFESSLTTHRCMITAHGGYWMGTGKFTIPQGITIYLYAPHGTVLSDPGIDFLTNEKGNEPIDILQGGSQCWNYILSKYQGRHGSQKETYQSIASHVKKNDDIISGFNESINTALDKGNEVAANKMINYAIKNRGAHVVTIRHRRFKADVNLKHVIDKVTAAYPDVTEFHCSHCRSNQYLPT